MQQLLKQIRQCKECAGNLPLGPLPVVTASVLSRIVIVGQAPGLKVHQSGIPWDDKSGDNLRDWLGVEKDVFYDTSKIALVPMGFCYPGTGKSGDLPPRKECAPLWHTKLFSKFQNVQLILLVGKYAQDYYLGKTAKKNLTTTVSHYREYLPKYLPLPHPSPRNNIWQKKNPWFKEELIPALKKEVKRVGI